MPSIQDVADQINAKLDQINTNTATSVTIGNGIRTDIGQTNAKLDTLDAHLQAGVSELANGIFAIFELHKATNAILEHQSKQNDTIICLITNTNELLCGITRKLTRQLALSEQTLTSVKRIEGIAERAEPAAAGDYDRLAELDHRLLECCPPEQPKPEACPEPCPVPRDDPYRPKGQDWRPRPQRDPVR
ncbi:MAG: hypothetical protein IT306_24075 [Chloroflexi bacterium]|nr:hypothetical protein [Chloroflexota bacterium]